MKKTFARFSTWVSMWMGSPSAFIAALGITVLWALSGPLFNFSDTWQLLINTPTTVVTFWAVFVIANTQNRDALATHAKLDAIIEALEDADSDLERIEDLTEDEIEAKRERRS